MIEKLELELPLYEEDSENLVERLNANLQLMNNKINEIVEVVNGLSTTNP